ncbi:MAG: acetylornithine/succinylornithine family transaminase [Eubacteriales bacterium]|nr:acetylornithine/succinylornithine family transaminase [Eubacteriales bacterium]
MNIKEQDSLYIANTYNRFPVQIVRGEGSLLYDDTGKGYIDFGGGIAVNTFGVSDREWIAAITEQLGKFQHTSNLYFSSPDVLLAKMLCERTGMKKVFFSNSGAEANECAIKAARKYAADKYGRQRYNIITLKNSFHGRTITTLAATGQDSFHKDFLPLTEGFIHVEAGDMHSVRSFCSDGTVAAVMIEAVQGEGGVVPLDCGFVGRLAAFAEENDILLIADEVQCGNGRTGKLYGYMNYDINPDIITTAKGLAGGLPLGATLLGEKVKDTFTPGTHGSTFGGNPVCCAGAVNILSRIDEKVLDEVKIKSDYIIKELNTAEGVVSVTGMGLMLGIETKGDSSLIISECMARGVLPLKAKNKVRLLPALNIPDELLEKAVAIIKSVCKEVCHEA